MALNKSYTELKSDSHLESWQQEMDESVGKSSKELEIYNQKLVDTKIKDLYIFLTGDKEQGKEGLKDVEFIKEVKEEHPDSEIFAVGGLIRDRVYAAILEFHNLQDSQFSKDVKNNHEEILGSSKDIDLVVANIEPVDLIKILLKYGEVTFDRQPNVSIASMEKEQLSKLVKENFGVLKFYPNDRTLSEPIDIAFPRIDLKVEGDLSSGIPGVKRDIKSEADSKLNIKDDLARRDFPFGAMALNLMNGDFYDPFNGIGSLARGKIETVGEPETTLKKEDITRIFRAMRFASQFNLELGEGVKKIGKEIFSPGEIDSKQIILDKINLARENLKKLSESGKEVSFENLKEAVRNVFNLENISTEEHLEGAINQVRERIIDKRGIVKNIINKYNQIHDDKGRYYLSVLVEKLPEDVKVGQCRRRVKEIKEVLISLLDFSRKNFPRYSYIFTEALECLEISDLDLMRMKLERIENRTNELNMKLRNNFDIPPNEELPSFLYMFCDKEKAKPQIAVTKEVIAKEFRKGFLANPEKFLEVFEELGAMEYFMPEFSKLRGVNQPLEYHREGDVNVHTWMVLRNLPENSPFELQMAALCHDLGKPGTYDDSQGKITFYHHDKEGAKIYEKIERRFGFTGATLNSENVKWLIKKHMFLLRKEVSDETLIQVFIKEDPERGRLLMDLSRADALSSLNPEGIPYNLKTVEKNIERIETLRKIHGEKHERPDPFLNGRDLIKMGLGIDPGPQFGTIMEDLLERQVSKKITTREQAEYYVKQKYCKLVTGNDLIEAGIPQGSIYKEILFQIAEKFAKGDIKNREEALAELDRLALSMTSDDAARKDY